MPREPSGPTFSKPALGTHTPICQRYKDDTEFRPKSPQEGDRRPGESEAKPSTNQVSSCCPGHPPSHPSPPEGGSSGAGSLGVTYEARVCDSAFEQICGCKELKPPCVYTSPQWLRALQRSWVPLGSACSSCHGRHRPGATREQPSKPRRSPQAQTPPHPPSQDVSKAQANLSLPCSKP